METHKFEIFSGTGGVGKTTLATSRAVFLAEQGRRVLLITIDPAKRLRDLLGLREEQAGDVVTVSYPQESSNQFDVELMNPEKTFNRIAKESGRPDILDNRILKILTKPYGGLNEILSIVELNMQYNRKVYDTIVLDTPPGSHFLDFLDSVERIRVFFDQSFIDIFSYLGKSVESAPGMNIGKKMITMVVSGGVKKLLGYLKKVTGEAFVDDFIEAVLAIYSTKESFLGALNLQKVMRDQTQSRWYLVTSVEQNKLNEALEIKAHAKGMITEQSYIVLNKCLEKDLASWEVAEQSQESQLKATLISREQKLKSGLQQTFKKVLTFPEVFSLSPDDHLNTLTTNWKYI